MVGTPSCFNVLFVLYVIPEDIAESTSTTTKRMLVVIRDRPGYGGEI